METKNNLKYSVDFYIDGSKKEEKWLRRINSGGKINNPTGYTNSVWLNGCEYELYREDYENPVLIRYLPDGYVYDTWYMKDGNPHRLDGPAIERTLPNSTNELKLYFIDGEEVQKDDPRLKIL